MSDGDTARETVGPASHRDPEAWCSERGHYRPERPRPGFPDGDITGPNGRTLVFPDGDITGQNGRGLVFRTGTLQARTAEPWCSRTGTLQDKTAEAWCSERGHYRPERPNPGVPGRGHCRTKRPRPGVHGRGHYRPERPRPGVPGRGHYRPRFPARLPTGWHRRLLIFLSNTPQIMWCWSGRPVLFFAVVALVVCRRRRVIFLRGAVYDGRIGQAL